MGRKININSRKWFVIELLDGLYFEEMFVFFIFVEIFEFFWSRGVVVVVIRVDFKFFVL